MQLVNHGSKRSRFSPTYQVSSSAVHATLWQSLGLVEGALRRGATDGVLQRLLRGDKQPGLGPSRAWLAGEQRALADALAAPTFEVHGDHDAAIVDGDAFAEGQRPRWRPRRRG